ncbi:cation:proton antiporter [Pontixanthobacter aestiaquae]|uniref:Sodium:proton antiporter n=1 Tax=Pontixanthobacter aestiaquae TaxID=1509367 RepID=A0A844Z7J3_9SPHN|nr:cation:proton antiporter [Pontixanthobacter aestiaquae]MDN3646145.1 cation:proton antiporter [Pontixanthobacter aestiaquae]MXO82863.1 sodium:proton antiporter [Pontixanthobacter aestiaquae]
MDARILFFAIFGLALMLAVMLERKLSRSLIPLPVLYVGVGYLLFSMPLGLPNLNPVGDTLNAITLEYVTEFIVIASLAAAGIAIDRPVNWKNWRQIWPLLLIAMPLTIALTAWLGWWALGLAPASAILLGAAMAPTDPVLARSVQVGPPGDNERHDLRFSLTAEAGLNDGLAFPFTYLAIAAIGATTIGGWTLEWFALDFVWRILAGTAVGYGIGRLGAWYVFEREADGPADKQDDGPEVYSTSEGLIVLGTLLLAYGVAELVEGYGFIAVFVGAVTARQRENASRYHKMSHHFIDQIEKIVLVAVLLGFGGMLAGGILDALTVPAALVGLALIFLIRPASGVLSESLSPLPWAGKFAVAFLGIRGMGSIYYMAYGQNHGDFTDVDILWATISFTILVSIVVHGIASGRGIEWVEARGGHIHLGENEAMHSLSPDGEKTLEIESASDQAR